MIIIENNGLFYEDIKEINKSEESLTNKIRLEARVKCEPIIDYKMVLIPYQNYNGQFTHNEIGSKKDIYKKSHSTYLIPYITCYAEERINQSVLKTEDSVLIDFDKIPEKYSFMDSFIFPQGLGTNSVHSVFLNFVQEESKNETTLFEYEKRLTLSKNIHGIFLGTFGKVSDGWKFYPKFIDTLMGERKILSLAIGENYD